jgi:Ca2+-binding EF-hand superfamily protein
VPFTPSSSKSVPSQENPEIPSGTENQQWLVAKIYEREIEAHFTLEALKQRLVNCDGFSIETVFRLIDVPNKGQIDSDAFFVFLSGSSVSFHEEELLAIFRACDSNFDGEINIEDLAKAILPENLLSTLRQKSRGLSPKTNASKIQVNVLREKKEKKEQEEARRKAQKIYAETLRTKDTASPKLGTIKRSDVSSKKDNQTGFQSPNRGRGADASPARKGSQTPKRNYGGSKQVALKSRNQGPVELAASETEVELLPPSESNRILNPFALYLKKVGEFEDSLEKTKSLLMKQEDFSVSRIFTMFSSKGNGIWNPLDFRKFLTAINVFEPESKVAMLFRRLKLKKTVTLR